MTSSQSPHHEKLSQQREGMRVGLLSAVEEEADPLAAYDDFVKWTLQNYSNHSESGLLELLEEAVRKFRSDVRYKTGDLRYVKLWILFANHVEKPVEVYAYMFQEGIGKPYSIFFEEYAEALEREGSFSEAVTVITLGIRTQARPLKRLQAFHSDLTARRVEGKPLPTKVSPFRGSLPQAVGFIRAFPLQNIAPRNTGNVTLPAPANIQHHDVSMTTTHAIMPTEVIRPNPYAHLNAPIAPGKRPEKLQFDLTLLLEPDGTEYCFEEARARHLGLLGKKWPSPPPPNASGPNPVAELSNDGKARERSVKVDFNDQGTKSGRVTRRQSVTVTINTKEALNDVLDMYNSPVKETEDSGGREDGANPRKIELDKAQSTPASVCPPFRDENAGAITKPRPFQPFVDRQGENATPGPLKFMPVAARTPGSNAFTPGTARKALVSKDIVTPVPAFKVIRPEQTATTPIVPSELRSLAEEEQDPNEMDVFGGDDITGEEFTEEFTNPPPAPPPPLSFVPFVDEHLAPQTQQIENVTAAATSKILKFQVHRDENASPPSHPPQKAIVRPFQSETHDQPVHSGADDDGSTASLERADTEYGGRHPFTKSGRFADFDVMTPITERTFEFTTSTRAIYTPGSERSSVYDKGFVALDAQDVAEKLAAELEAEEQMERGTAAISFRDPLLGPGQLSAPYADESSSSTDFSFFDRPRSVPFRVSDGFTIEPNHSNLLSSAVVVDTSTTENLTEVLVANAAFEPPNPCIPSDPAILSKFIAFFPPDPDHRELGHNIYNRLEKLHRFIEKLARRGSCASRSEKLVLELDGDHFELLDKLGEGSFGAVFMAKSMQRAAGRLDEDSDEGYEDEDEDEDELVAIKVVRPTNRWESFVLHRVTSAIPEELRRSIIRPHTLYAYKDESYLTLELCQQGTLLEVVNRATETGVAQPGGGVDELLVMFFTVELLRIIQGLHDNGFIHGDLKIDNCLIRLDDVPGGSSAWSGEYSPAGADGWAHKGIKLIDFGRTIDTRLFPAGQTFVADWPTDARDCAEMREGRPWTFQADYAGLASIVYCMLFGKYIETAETTSANGVPRLKPVHPMKRYWQVDFWNRLFDALLNPCAQRPGGALPITRELIALREELEVWVQANCNRGGKNLKGMLKKIEIATLRRAPRK